MTRLLCVDLTTAVSSFVGGQEEGLKGDDLLYTDPSGAWVALAYQKTIYDYPSVSRIDLATNKSTTIVRERDDVWDWYADADGVVRVGLDWDARGWSMVYRSHEADKFRKLGRAKYGDESAGLDLIRLATGTDDGYVLSNKGTGRFALRKFNYATKQMGDVIFDSPTNDITDYTTSRDGKTLESVLYTDDRDRVMWFDPKLKKVQSDIDASVKQNENWIISRSRDDSAMIVWTGASNDPGSFYLYRPDVGIMSRLAKINDALKPSEMAVTHYLHYPARDGLSVPAYLTLPLGRDAKGLPLIVLPHGGPYGVRDRSDYDPEVQFLVNRGYAVLQPNYRGSDGYGKDFYEKGEGQWGRAMQDDLDDGMDWLAKQGTIDPKRVCIIGSSYGGYASLWGATRNPERYRCAASFAGVTDLGRQLKYQIDFKISKRYRRDWRRTVQGKDDFDPHTVSPLYNIAQLKVPVLLAHGDSDQTVPYRQSKLYVDALKKAGKSVEFYSYEDEGHGFSKPGTLKDWLDRLDVFLKRYNPA